MYCPSVQLIVCPWIHDPDPHWKSLVVDEHCPLQLLHAVAPVLDMYIPAGHGFGHNFGLAHA